MHRIVSVRGRLVCIGGFRSSNISRNGEHTL